MTEIAEGRIIWKLINSAEERLKRAETYNAETLPELTCEGIWLPGDPPMNTGREWA